MDAERTIDIAAPPDRVWAVMTDVERWPEWTASVSQVALLDNRRLEVGTRARILQPGLPSAVWTVTVVEPGRFFEWESAVLGLRSVGGHRVEPKGVDGALVTLSLKWSGPLAPLIRLFWGKLARRYVEMEALGLKQRSERA